MRLFRGPKRREVTEPQAAATPSPRRDVAAGPAPHDFTLVTALPAMVMEEDVKEMKKGNNLYLQFTIFSYIHYLFLKKIKHTI